ncbi:MAG: Tad domain-containing protein [Candidatus Riflebacteria bacterium]|nr:Tad domain-containing protein [Candidatus Riflebacteria bacterium]
MLNPIRLEGLPGLRRPRAGRDAGPTALALRSGLPGCAGQEPAGTLALLPSRGSGFSAHLPIETSRPGRRRSRRGMVLVFYMLALMVILAFVGLVVDIGYMYTQKAQKQLLSDMIALTALGTTGTVAGGQTATQQDTYINNFVATANVATGLPSDMWPEILKDHNADGDVYRVTLNKPMVLTTFFLNVLGLRTITVGIQSIAIRECVVYQISQEGSGPLQFFGCNAIEMQGNPTLRSKKYSTGAVGDNVFGGSNELVHSQGSVLIGGSMFSADELNFTGNATTWNGTYQSGDIDGSPGGGVWTAINSPHPPVVVPPAVGQATAAVNDNDQVLGCSDAFIDGTSFLLDKPGGSPGEIIIPAGSKIYAREVDLKNARLIIRGDPRPPPTGSGPVSITLDAQGQSDFDIWFSDRDMELESGDPMGPHFLDVIGINAPNSCCPACTPGPIMTFKHHSAYGHVYAPGDGADDAAVESRLHLHSRPADQLSGPPVAELLRGTSGSLV